MKFAIPQIQSQRSENSQQYKPPSHPRDRGERASTGGTGLRQAHPGGVRPPQPSVLLPCHLGSLPNDPVVVEGEQPWHHWIAGRARSRSVLAVGLAQHTYPRTCPPTGTRGQGDICQGQGGIFLLFFVRHHVFKFREPPDSF